MDEVITRRVQVGGASIRIVERVLTIRQGAHWYLASRMPLGVIHEQAGDVVALSLSGEPLDLEALGLIEGTTR